VGCTNVRYIAMYAILEWSVSVAKTSSYVEQFFADLHKIRANRSIVSDTSPSSLLQSVSFWAGYTTAGMQPTQQHEWTGHDWWLL